MILYIKNKKNSKNRDSKTRGGERVSSYNLARRLSSACESRLRTALLLHLTVELPRECALNFKEVSHHGKRIWVWHCPTTDLIEARDVIGIGIAHLSRVLIEEREHKGQGKVRMQRSRPLTPWKWVPRRRPATKDRSQGEIRCIRVRVRVNLPPKTGPKMRLGVLYILAFGFAGQRKSPKD